MAKGSIVVGTDGSERAERAVDRAGELARALGVKVNVVSAYSEASDAAMIPLVTPGAPATQVREESEKHTRARQYADRAQQRLAQAGVGSETHVWPSDPAEALVQVAEEQHAQMIVVGNRGMTGARRVLGSVPNHVSHHAGCDVLIVSTSDASD
ncbi:MAG TPA: universal stress protein [Solirubrobacteraceae bacterium]|nr:universal stress protein [Solirubrobacteraceae bacterium]